MTNAEWEKEERRLKGAITRASNKVKKLSLLAEKIQARKTQRDLEAKLYAHRLNYFDLVTDF